MSGNQRSAIDVQRRLNLHESLMSVLDGVAPPVGASGPQLPDDDEAHAVLERMGVDPSALAETLAARPDPIAHPDLWWVLDRAYYAIIADMGRNQDEAFVGWPPLPVSTGALGRHLYVWLFLALTPHLLRYHAARSIPADVSWATLRGVGEQMVGQRRVFGESGLYWLWALLLVYRGALYRLGRLVFNRGDGVLHVHIPEGDGFTPAACEAAFHQARRFFLRHYPDEPIERFVCRSWLLDEQWAAYLPETSNIVQFQRRFHLDPYDRATDDPPGDEAIMDLVFQQTVTRNEPIGEDVIGRMPQDTSLQRAFVAHLRAGKHWHTREGWFLYHDWYPVPRQSRHAGG